jgi:protein-S-isoprenylcysteine O-methyltransferase Ste14
MSIEMLSKFQLIAFLIGTILLILFSWFVSVREKRYHGIPRFFVFEGLLLLGLLQADAWFSNPFGPAQIISWILFIASICYALFGIMIYFREGNPGENFENTTRLVTSGLYKYIRHPMYASLLFLGWGMLLKDLNPVTVNITGFLSLAVYITCRVEEKEMISRFGEEYREYMKKTRMWVPWLI